MLVFPTPEEKRALCQILIRHVARGPVEKPVLEFLFRESIRVGDKPSHISEGHILESCPEGPPTDGAVRATLTRLRKDIASFFSQHPVGRQERYRVILPLREYALQFEVNDPPPMSGDLVKSFWAPYYISDRPTPILYPEPLCFADRTGAVFHHPEAITLEDGRRCFSHLGIQGELVPSFPFVHAGAVQALTTLFECLQRPPRTCVTARPVRSTGGFQEKDEDIIVLGSLATMPLLADFEAGCPLRTGKNSILFRSEKGKPETYSDNDRQDSPTTNDFASAWGLLTRTSKRFEGRSITLVSAQTSQAIEAICAYITNQQQLESLAESFQADSFFPDRFQVLFEIFVLNSPGEIRIHHIAPKHSIPLC